MKYLGLSIGLVATALFAGACNGSESSSSGASVGTSGVSASSPGTGQTSKAKRPQPVDPEQTCSTDPIQWVVGQAATQETVQRARQESGADSVRVLKPDMAVTQEFKYGRLNLNVDADNVVTSASCW